MARPTLAVAAAEYLRARTDLARESKRSASYTLDRFVAAVGAEMEVKRLGTAHVAKWLEGLHGEVSPNTVRRQLSQVRQFCRWLIIHRRLHLDPTASLPKVRVPRAGPRELDPDAVAKTLVSAPDERARLVVLLMVTAGLRCKEVAGLQIGDVNVGAGTVHVVHGKGGDERTVVLTDEAAEAFRAYMGAYPAAAGPLIRSYMRPRAGIGAKHLGNLVVGWMNDAGIKGYAFDGVSAHALRHTHAGDLLDAGADPRDVQMEMGHANLATTSRYWQRRQNIERLQALERRRWQP